PDVEQFVQPWLGRGKEKPVGVVAKPLVGAEHPDQLVHLVIVGLRIVIAYGPVVPMAIDALVLEIVRAEAQRYPAPVVRAAAQHVRAEPVELRAVLVRVRLTLYLPATIGGIEVPEGTYRT